MTKPNIFTCNWTLFPVMDVIEAARFTAREGFAGMELECTPLGFWPTTIVLKDLIVHMHLDDGRTAGVSEHLPLGEGLADFSPLAEFIARMEGAAVLEIYAPERPVQATLESRNYLLNILRPVV